MKLNTYDRVIAKLDAGQRVSMKELSQAWRECPTSTPPKIFREYTASVLEQMEAAVTYRAKKAIAGKVSSRDTVDTIDRAEGSSPSPLQIGKG